MRRIRRRREERRKRKMQDCNTVVYSFSVHCRCLLLLRNGRIGGDIEEIEKKKKRGRNTRKKEKGEE